MEWMGLEGTPGGHLVQPTYLKLHELEQKAQHLLTMVCLFLRTFHNYFIRAPHFLEVRFTVSARNHMPVVNGSVVLIGDCRKEAVTHEDPEFFRLLQSHGIKDRQV